MIFNCERDAKGRIFLGCPKRCPLIHQPVCGTDGKTYNGKCQMKVTACLTNTDIKVAYDGQCRGQGGEFGLPPPLAANEAEEEDDCDMYEVCQFNYKPVCGSGIHKEILNIFYFHCIMYVSFT